MAITAELIKAEERDTFWKLGVEYVDTDTGKSSKDYFKFNGDAKSLKRHVINNLKVKEEVKSFDFKTLRGTIIDITPDVIEPPTTEAIAKAQWFKDWAQFKEVQLLLNSVSGLATVSRVQFKDTLEASLEADWLDSYLGDL